MARFGLGRETRRGTERDPFVIPPPQSRAQQHLPPGTSIMDVYDEAEHELLILGEPGAGKSTLLLDLAEHLLVRAEQDQTHPLPIILPLSSWAAKRPKIADWIAEQLSQIYDVPRKLSIQWVEAKMASCPYLMA